jgi:peptide subunit release factor 1 (eRF1)
VVRSSVKAKHGKGGFSQRRFERLREEDIAHHVEKVRGVLNEFKGQPDRIILCGDLLLAEEIVKGAELPATPVSRKIDARIDTKKPENILREILSYRRYRL